MQKPIMSFYRQQVQVPFVTLYVLCNTHLFLLSLQFSHSDVPGLCASSSLRSKSSLRLHKRENRIHLNSCNTKQSEQEALCLDT